MTAPAPNRRLTGFFLGFLLVALIIAGGLSYFASSDPDGLDKTTEDVCSADGECIADFAQDSPTAGSPLADYGILGGEGTVGAAGVIGVLVTLVVAGGLFWVLRRRDPPRSET